MITINFRKFDLLVKYQGLITNNVYVCGTDMFSNRHNVTYKKKYTLKQSAISVIQIIHLKTNSTSMNPWKVSVIIVIR